MYVRYVLYEVSWLLINVKKKKTFSFAIIIYKYEIETSKNKKFLLIKTGM